MDTSASTRGPAPPRGLGPAGRRFWREIADRWDLDTPPETATVELAARQLDLVADLEAAVRRDGLLVDGPGGRQRVHPAATALSSARQVLLKLLGSIDLPVESGEPGTPSGRKAQRAAQIRWNRHRQRTGVQRGTSWRKFVPVKADDDGDAS